MKFNVGDRVEITARHVFGLGNLEGIKATVLEVTDKGYKVTGFPGHFPESILKPAEPEPETYTLELTKEELDFIYTRCSRKAARLEEAHLEDIPCYHLSWQVMTKISKVRKNQNDILKGESV